MRNPDPSSTVALLEPVGEQLREFGVPELVQWGRMGKRIKDDLLCIVCRGYRARELGFVLVVSLPEGLRRAGLGIGGEPSEGLGPQCDHAVTFPVLDEQLGDEGPE